MDTHISTHPEIDADIAGISARLPGEADTAQPEPTSPEPDSNNPPASAPKLTRRRPALLAGAAVVALALAGGGAFLLSPYTPLSPMPRLQPSADHAASIAEAHRRPLVAPAASLAKVSVPPSPPATQAHYTPKPREQEVAELLLLHPGASASATAAPAKAAGQPARVIAPRPADTPGETGAAAGDVPHEPGAPSAAPVREATRTALPQAPAPKAVTPLIVAALPQAEPNARVAGLDQTVVAPEASLKAPSQPKPMAASPSPAPPHPPETLPADATGPQMPPVPPHDPLVVAANLHIGPMTPPEQVQVLNLVTEMAAMVRDLRRQDAQMRVDFAKSSASVTAQLADYERRLALAEANTAVAAAHDPSMAAPAPPAMDTMPVVVKPVMASVSRPIPLASAAAPAPAAPKLYRVQAASPGLALLAQVDRGGGDGAQLQVVVGDTVPDYGRVKSIGQKGTAWVVTTEHGQIQ